MYYNKKENVYIVEGNSFVIDGNQYPANWLVLSTPEEKIEAGLEEVIAINSPADARFYWVSTATEGATISYINVPMDLNAVKATQTTHIKSIAFNTLSATDYIDIRNMRDPSYKPEWVTWREATRTAASNVVAELTAAIDVPAIEAILQQFSWPHDPDYVALPTETPIG